MQRLLAAIRVLEWQMVRGSYHLAGRVAYMVTCGGLECRSGRALYRCPLHQLGPGFLPDPLRLLYTRHPLGLKVN
jgi:hypothetical protein